MEWISVNKYMPPVDCDWLIVRAINKDECSFYFMAIYEHNEWNYLDENENQDRQTTMQVTHWAFPDSVIEPDIFTKEKSK